MTRRWSLFGLCVASELTLAGPSLGETREPADVSVRVETLPRLPASLALCAPNVLQFEVAGVGRFRVSAGREIIVDPAPEASERNLRVYVLGSAFGALLHQRGLLPLHANAVIIDGRAVAFAGPSGAGKSTLAAWFEHRGHPVLADDICALAVGTHLPLALPGVPRLRLWDDALRMLGRDAQGLERSFDGQEKFDLLTQTACHPASLAGVYLLHDSPSGRRDLQVDRLSGVAAVEALIANTYRGGLLRALGRASEHARLCLQMAHQVPVIRLGRGKDRDAFQNTAEAIEAEVRELVARTPASYGQIHEGQRL